MIWRNSPLATSPRRGDAPPSNSRSPRMNVSGESSFSSKRFSFGEPAVFSSPMFAAILFGLCAQDFAMIFALEGNNAPLKAEHPARGLLSHVDVWPFFLQRSQASADCQRAP
mmetsp:Transcript_26136/g.62111  ORF Transcript_26136/g.62111 Transcript_26136/m.62111 type:complete len:112 (-) Transcript_26136:9-344(-)